MRRPQRVVTVRFEPGRLGEQILIDAYAQLVPIRKRGIQRGEAGFDVPVKPSAGRTRRTSR